MVLNLEPGVVSQITPPIFIGLVTIVVANIANFVLKKLFKNAEATLEKLAEKHKNDEYRKRIAANKTKFVFMRRIVAGVIYVVGIMFMIASVPSLRTFSYSLLAGAGVMAVILGFATQKTFANIISGLMISVSQPFRIGDRVKLREEYGTIEDITLRHTVLKTWDNRRVIIPNAIMNDEVVNNYTLDDEKILSTVEMNISYESDIDLARRIMQDEIIGHPDFISNQSEGEIMDKSDYVKVRVVNCGESAVTLRGYYWVASQPKAFRSACDLRERIKKMFDKEGVQIPYPHRVVLYKKDLNKPRAHEREGRKKK